MIQVDAHKLANLIRNSVKYELLEAGGVDNWEWYRTCLYENKEENVDDMSDEEVIKYYL